MKSSLNRGLDGGALKCTFSFRAHTSAIYCLLFAGTPSKPVLVSGGDEEICVWGWVEILSAISCLGSTGLQPLGRFQNPQAKGRRGATGPIPETNDLTCNIDTAGNLVYAACGDGLVHMWDLAVGERVKSFVGHSDYLHAAATLPESTCIASAGEDGTVRTWDTRDSRCVSVVRPFGEGPSIVRSLLADSQGNWLVCGGDTPKKGYGHASGGAISLLHHGLVAGLAPAPAPVHALCECDGLVASVGADEFVRNWQRDLSRMLTSTATRSGKCLYSIDYNEHHNLMVCSGTSPRLDVFMANGDACSRLMVLQGEV